jgi:RNA polymerase sigma-70 factor (ECF subfamily)
VLNSLELPSTEPAPGDNITTVAELARLREALEGLPAEQRRCLLLAVFHGLSGREISELDDVPLGTVKTRIRAALLTLRSSLEVHDD